MPLLPLTFADSVLEVDAAHGCAWYSLRLAGYQVLQPEPDPQAAYHGSLLFPWPNRLADGAYTLPYERAPCFQLAINDTERHTALHGLVAHLPFAVTARQPQPGQYDHLQLSADFGGHPGYPWCARLTVDFFLRADSLSCQTTVQALEPLPAAAIPRPATLTQSAPWDAHWPMPVGLGWHPYFALGGLVDDWTLQLPHGLRRLPTDARLLPNGPAEPYADFTQLRPIGATAFDTCFALPANPGPCTVRVRAPGQRHGLAFWMETDPDGNGYQYLQLYTPPHRQSLALEPMTCAPNAFNNGMGVQYLSPGEVRQLNCGLRFVI